MGGGLELNPISRRLLVERSDVSRLPTGLGQENGESSPPGVPLRTIRYQAGAKETTMRALEGIYSLPVGSGAHPKHAWFRLPFLHGPLKDRQPVRRDCVKSTNPRIQGGGVNTGGSGEIALPHLEVEQALPQV